MTEQIVRAQGSATAVGSRRLPQKALPEHTRRRNRALLLQHLFHSGAMSRADLARRSSLTRVTVGDVIAELQAEGIVHELGQRKGSRPGKPATLVDIDRDAFHIAAIDLSAEDSFVGVIADVFGRVQHRIDQPFDGATGEAAVEKVLALIAALVAASPARVLGIGIGTPGLVDAAGVVRQAANLDWYDLDLGARIRSSFGYPVYVANDANAAALGVRTLGRDDATGTRTLADSVMVIRIEQGVGAGLVIGGALVEGEQYAAGELGHVVVDESGERCVCGRNGCLELALAAPQLRRRLAAASASEREQILSAAGRALGIAMSPVLGVLNLNLVVLSGPAELISGTLIDTARATIRARTMSAVSNGLDLRAASGDEDLVLMGATALVLSGELGVS